MEKVIYAVRMNGERVDPPYKPPSQGTGNPVRLLLTELQQPVEPSKGEPLLILFQFVSVCLLTIVKIVNKNVNLMYSDHAIQALSSASL